MKKHSVIILLTLLVTVFVLTRLYNILSLPIFTDEAIYIRWSQIARFDANWRFISLTDGKQPSLVWLTMTVMRWVEDPLLAGRLVSVGAGLTSMIGLFFLGKALFRNKWVGITSSVLYLVFPMALVYDRMALYDSLVGTFAVWSLYASVLLVRRIRLDIALILGMILGGGVLNKTSGFISAYLIPLSLLLFDFAKERRYERLGRFVLLALLSVAFMYVYYSILRLSPFFHIINEKNAIFYYPLHEWLLHPFTFFWGNLLGLWDWFTRYLTWPIVLLITLSFLMDRKLLREKLLLLLWFMAPFVIFAMIGKVLYPRFIFFMTLSLLPLAAYTLYRFGFLIRNRLLLGGVFLLFFLLPLRSDFYILTDFARAPIPNSDLTQYINDWPAGGGIKEAIAFFETQSKKEKIFIGTDGTFGLLPYALEIYLVNNPNIAIKGFWPLHETPPEELLEQSQKMPAYFVFNQPCISCQRKGEAPPTWKMPLLMQYRKGIGESFLSIYQISP